MHLWGCIPLHLLALLPLVQSAQVPFQTNVTIYSKNIIDYLSDDADYTSLLRLLQRAKLIPTLNKLNGTTLFAPTNDAIKRHAESNPLWRTELWEDDASLRDNVQERLRQELFYHLLNETVDGLPNDKSPAFYETLHYPRIPKQPPSRDPPPYPPWMPQPGGTLGGKPQRLRAASRDDAGWVGVDAFGDGGVEVVKKPLLASNGALLGIGDVLQVPPDVASVISNHPSLSYLRNILTPELVQFLNATAELTMFLPVDKAWEALPHYERLYLESKYATDDLTRIVNMHSVASKRVHYAESFTPGTRLTTEDGQTLKISQTEDGKTNIASAELVEPDIYASNGVVHTVSSLLVPPGALQLTPEKYLLVFNCTSFVSLLHSVNLTHLINDTETKWTILAPRDDVLGLFGEDELPPRGSEELKKMLQYHFLPGKRASGKLKDGMLLETALEEEGLDGGRQVLTVDVAQSADKPSISFSGAGVLGEPVEVNNTLIYFISRPLTPPTDPLTTAFPSLHLSTFLAAIFSTTLADKLKTLPRTTFLIPHNNAFKRLGSLVSAHLTNSKADLESVIQHHIISGVEYKQSIVDGSQRTYGTLEGSDIHVERHSADNSTVLTASGGWADMHSTLFANNTLTQTGVIHEVSDIMIPRTVNITIGKLMRAAKGTTMLSLVSKAGMDWVLNGTAPPEGSRWADMDLGDAGWTLLCPTDDGFKDHNLTELYADPDRMEEIVTQHLIPVQSPITPPPHELSAALNDNRPLVMDNSATYTTLLTQAKQSLYSDVVFRELDGKGTVVGIKGARGSDGRDDWATVVAWGRATTSDGRGGVVQIDRVLIPYQPTVWVSLVFPIAVGIFGSLSILAFFVYGVRKIWNRDTTEATYEPVGGFGASEDDEEVARS